MPQNTTCGTTFCNEIESRDLIFILALFSLLFVFNFQFPLQFGLRACMLVYSIHLAAPAVVARDAIMYARNESRDREVLCYPRSGCFPKPPNLSDPTSPYPRALTILTRSPSWPVLSQKRGK